MPLSQKGTKGFKEQSTDFQVVKMCTPPFPYRQFHLNIFSRYLQRWWNVQVTPCTFTILFVSNCPVVKKITNKNLGWGKKPLPGFQWQRLRFPGIPNQKNMDSSSSWWIRSQHPWSVPPAFWGTCKIASTGVDWIARYRFWQKTVGRGGGGEDFSKNC